MRTFRQNQRVSGFTVLELMVTMAVVMVLTGVAIPSLLDWLPTLRLSSAARQVATDLQVARMRAISQNASNTVTFNTSNGTYTFTLGSDSRSIGDLYPGITILSGAANPVFTPRGTASTPGTITLSNGSATKQIEVSAVGRVRVP